MRCKYVRMCAGIMLPPRWELGLNTLCSCGFVQMAGPQPEGLQELSEMKPRNRSGFPHWIFRRNRMKIHTRRVDMYAGCVEILYPYFWWWNGICGISTICLWSLKPRTSVETCMFYLMEVVAGYRAVFPSLALKTALDNSHVYLFRWSEGSQVTYNCFSISFMILLFSPVIISSTLTLNF